MKEPLGKEHPSPPSCTLTPLSYSVGLQELTAMASQGLHTTGGKLGELQNQCGLLAPK